MANEIHRAFRVIFAKKDRMKFISHLDLMRLFQRVARRADLPLAISQGFSPRPKISFKRALKLGIESESEEATFRLKGEVSSEDFKNRFQAQLPEGIVIKNIEVID